MQESLKEEIAKLKEKKNAIILAHNYQLPEVQDIADYIGDSLGLSMAAKETDKDIIVFCGVHFMAETASILCPDKKVLLPDLEAGCSLADSITVEDLREWKKEYPPAVVVSYVNTTAEIKALSDYCCTSSNAVKVIESIPEDRDILFLPDMFLGAYIKNKTNRKMHIWPGECHVHANIRPEDINILRKEHKSADFLIHPECGCATSCMYYTTDGSLDSGDFYILSTEGMIRHIKNSPKDEFIIATEVGILYRMEKEFPNRTYYSANREAICQYMKLTTLEKVLHSLKNEVYEIKVPEDIRERAYLPIKRMVEIV